MEKKLAIKISNATIQIQNKKILDSLTLEVKQGAKYFILGTNGSGKTTLVKTLLGYLWPLQGGYVEVLGEEYGKTNLNILRKSISWVSPFLNTTVNTNITGVDMILSGKVGALGFYRKATQEELDKVEKLLISINGINLANKYVSQMSSGEQMKILIARALISKPKLLILDEPSVFLDIKEREAFLKIVKKLANQKNITIIFISQRIEDILPEFTEGMILKDGKILKHGIKEKVLTTNTMKKAFGINIELIKTNNGRYWSVVK